MAAVSPPERPHSDIEQVLEAAAVLDIAEVQLFREAYGIWFGRRVDEPTLDRHFVAYMFAGVVPHWVRDYARRVLSEAGRHELDPVKFGVLPNLRRRPRIGLGVLAAQLALFVVLVLVANWSLQFVPGLRSCLLPPCY